MAAGMTFRCDRCARSVEGWDEGNPYYLDENGTKHYVYHPSGDIARCTGNDADVICLACGVVHRRDAKATDAPCAHCGERAVVSTWGLQGRRCPYCRTGAFEIDPHGFRIS